MDYFDIVIIGGGPNGLYCCHQLSRYFSDKSIVVLEKGEILQHIKNYPDVMWHSRMAELKLPSVTNDSMDDKHHPTSSQLARYYEKYAQERQLNVRENHEVTDIFKREGEADYTVCIKNHDNKITMCGRIVILCVGIYGNPKKMAVKSDYPFCSHYANLNVVGENIIIVGAGASAVDCIIHLLPHNNITWVMRGDSLHTLPVEKPILKKFNKVKERHTARLSIHRNATVQEIYDDRRILLSNGVLIKDAGRCYLLLGFNSVNPMLKQMGLEYENECLRLSPAFETNLKNIYAFGAVMGDWNHENMAPNPTYIHNGNSAKLKVLINDIAKKNRQYTPFVPEIPVPRPPWRKRIIASLRRHVSGVPR